MAVLITALATFGGYRLTNLAGSAHGKVILAQATRTWVSGVGDDANPCSRTAPCKTFAGAISKTAPGGEIDTLDPGGFGALTITKSITIDGMGGDKSSVLVAGTNGIVVAAGASDVVTIRHIQFQGLMGGGNANAGLNGIRFISGKALHLDDVVVEGFNGNGLDVAMGAPAIVTVVNSRFSKNGTDGASITDSSGTAQVTMSHSVFSDNLFGGVIAQGGSEVTVADSVLSENTQVGGGCVTAAATACTLHTAHDQLSHDGSGIFANHNAGAAQIKITMTDDDLYGNGNGIFNGGGNTQILSTGNNRFDSNGSDGATTGPLTVH